MLVILGWLAGRGRDTVIAGVKNSRDTVPLYYTVMQVWVVVFELSLLVVVLVKLGWDIVVYRQSGRLPWVARHLCFWSVPGISTARYTVYLRTL